MDYAAVPTSITLAELQHKAYCWSPAMYTRVVLPTSQTRPLKDLLDPVRPFDKGLEPGSMWYLDSSPFRFIRTKALQQETYLISPKGGAIVAINPRVFAGPCLSDGDILMSKDSNVGECAIVDGGNWASHMFSSGILRLHPTCDPYYLFAFLKHPLFKAQLTAMTARGSTIKHAKTLWLDCLIPFPRDPDPDRAIHYVATLTRAIIDKESTIRERSNAIHHIIDQELKSNQASKPFVFAHPTLHDLRDRGRLDAAIYGVEYRSKIWLLENYARGWTTPKADGFSITPGPSLEIKLLRTRIDSETYFPGYYALILPTNISEYGTMTKIPYLGTAKELPLLKEGDIVFGEAGFHKGRSIVLIKVPHKCTTNAHGLYARRTDHDLVKSIFFRCVFNWYRSEGLIDLMAVGGSGGHFSPEYFEYLKLPKFPHKKQLEIARLYHGSASPPPGSPTLQTFVQWHRTWNSRLGIYELDRETKCLQDRLTQTQEDIIQGRPVSVPT